MSGPASEPGLSPESLKTFQSSYASSKVKIIFENDDFRWLFDKWCISQPKTPKKKTAKNNRRILIAAVFHVADPVDKTRLEA